MAIPLSQGALDLVKRGVAVLWSRISAADPRAEDRPLLLSYDVHPTPHRPVLIEVNTNAGGLRPPCGRLDMSRSAPGMEHATLESASRVFRHDLLGDDPSLAGVVAIVDDELASRRCSPRCRACRLAASTGFDGSASRCSGTGIPRRSPASGQDRH